jgi:hypothetical protein
MFLPYRAFDLPATRGHTERRQRDVLLDRLAELVAASDDRVLLARLVMDLEVSANASLGAATTDPTVVLMRRFDRAHRRIITGPSTATAAGIQHWIAEFDGVGARHIEARPLGHPAPRGAARVGSTVVRAAPDRRNLPRSVRVRADGTCPQAS